MSIKFTDATQFQSRLSNTILTRSAPKASLAIGLVAGMIAIIAGTVFVGSIVAFASIPLFVIAVIALSFYKPLTAVAYYFTYSALEGMYKYLSDFSQVIYAIRPLLVIALLLGWFLSIRLHYKQTSHPPFAFAFGLLSLWALVECFSPTGSGVTASILTYLVWYFLPFSLYLLAGWTIHSRKQAETVLLVLMAVSTVVSAFALVQYGMGEAWTKAHLPGYENVTQHNWWITDENGRVENTTWSPASTTAYSGALSIWSNLGALLAMGLLFLPSGHKTRKSMLLLGLLINIMGLLIAGSRLWVIVFIIEVILFFVIASRTPREFIRNIGLLSGVALVSGMSYQAVQAVSGGMIAGRYAVTVANPVAKYQHDRGDNMAYLLPFLQSSPLGVGFQRKTEGGARFNNSNFIMTNRETQFNSIAADMGLPGLALLMFIVFGLLVQGWKALRLLKLIHTRILAAVLLVLLLGTVISFLGTPILQDGDYFWLSAGLLLALPTIEQREASDGAHIRRSV
jgi:hypothetical protein